MGILKRSVDGLIGLCATIGSIGLIFEVVLILVDVVVRFFGAPILGAQDMSQMAMTIVVFGGMALCDKLGGHIAIDVFEASYPPWLNHLADVVSAFLGAVIFACLAWTVYESSKISQMLNLATNIIGLPKHYFQWVVCIFSSVTAIAMLLRGIEMLFSKNTRVNTSEAST